jgi:hypothetical protein
MTDYDERAYAHFLALVADTPHPELTIEQATRLDDLADFVETIDLNDAGVIHLYNEPDDVLRRVIDLTVALYGFDRQVLAAEADVMLARMGEGNDLDPYFALFDASTERHHTNWEAVRDQRNAVQLLLHLFTLGPGKLASR